MTTQTALVRTKERLLSLDIFRGMTIIAMVLVNMVGDHDHAYAAITHVDWNGWSIADLVFPFFIFIVGVAMPYSFSKRLARGDSQLKLFGHILLRSVALFAIGLYMTWYYNLMNGVPPNYLSDIRLFGALQRIGFCYLFAAPLYLKLKNRGLPILSGVILVGHFILLRFIPPPGHTAPVLTANGSWVQYIDLHLMPGHLGFGLDSTWENKGFLGTAPGVVNMLIGVLAGLYLRSARSALEKVRGFLVAGNVGMVLGLIWSIWIPINQSLWTSSLVMFMCGMALVILACCYYVADVRKITW